MHLPSMERVKRAGRSKTKLRGDWVLDFALLALQWRVQTIQAVVNVSLNVRR